jgi:LPS-assembly protein
MKFSKNFDSVESRKWGLDGLKHVVQPFANLSMVSSNQDSSKILPIDSLNLATTLPPLDFPQFNAIDSITDWKILRLGMRHRLLTRRDNTTFSWMELDTFFDNRIEKPLIPSLGSLDPGSFSNLFNRLRWTPLPWMTVNLSNQLPVFDEGFSELNIDSTFQPTREFTFSVGSRSISGTSAGQSPLATAAESAANGTVAPGIQFQNSDLLYGSARLRINDDWAINFQETFEARTGQALYQRYGIDRSLRSWIASLNFLVFERNSRNDISVLFTLTLKDLPNIRLPLTFDPSASAMSNNVKNQ